jgi:glucan phosphorylase
MPLYKKRLVQSIRNGRQHIEYRDVSYEDQSIELVTDDWMNPMQFNVWGWDVRNTTQERQYQVTIYSIYRGGTLLYLIYCPEVFDILYPDDRTHQGYGREQRFLQETIFAECVYELLKSIHVVPDVLHLNEGHVADAAAIIKGDKAFDKTTIVYTNHTVVQAGLERFCINRLTGGDIGRARYAMRFLQPNYQRFWQKFSVQQDGQWFIDFSKGALEMCDVANGVSNEHAGATQALFPSYNRRIEAVLNGSGDTWIMDELMEAELKGAALNEETLLRAAAEGKARAFAEVKKRTADMSNRSGRIISQDGVMLNPDLPTVWMIRRMVRYKSQLPVLKEIIHVICANREDEVDSPQGRMNGLQMQVVVGGIAPEGSCEEGWIEEFISWMQKPELRGRFVFVPNTDTILLKMQAIGADICINCPLPGQEACGTSDQRSARNGGINIATRSGGPFEYIEDGLSGMLVGPYQNDMDFYNRAPRDILGKLRQLSDMYYNQNDGHNIWLEMKLESYLASSKVMAASMEQRYADLYAQALHIRKSAVYRVDRENYKTVHIRELPEPVLQLHEAERDFLYRNLPLKNDTVITYSLDFDQKQTPYLSGAGFDLFRDLMKNYFEFVKNGIGPDLVGKGLPRKIDGDGFISRGEPSALLRDKPGCNSIDASLLLFRAISMYLESTKDSDFPESMAHRIFLQKQTMILQFILKEIIDTCLKGKKPGDRWQEHTDDNSRTLCTSIGTCSY